MTASSDVDRGRAARPGWPGWSLVGLFGFVAAAAAYGGVGLIRDGLGMPADWADRLPFGSWVLGGVALLLTVAVPQLGAGWLVVARHPLAALGARAAGIALVAWIAVQLLVLQRYFFLQPVIAGLGLVEAALAWWWGRAGRRASGRSRELTPSG